MGIFRKKNKLSQSAISSIISEGMRIDGEVSFKGKCRLDGLVDGDVKGEYLIVSESGKICGDVELEVLVCHGTIQGNVKVEDITVHPSSSIHGSLAVKNLVVETGAVIEGDVRVVSELNIVKQLPGVEEAHDRQDDD